MTDSLTPMPFNLQNTLESYTDGILPVQGPIIIQNAHYKTSKLMPIQFFMVDIKNEVFIWHAVSIKLGLLKVLCHNRAA